MDFSDTTFLETSGAKAHANRLNWRCELLLTRHPEAVRDQRVLDLGCHDGRFAHASLALGARHVTGIEGRSNLVDSATANLTALGHSPDRFRLIQGDVFDVIAALDSGEYDTVLCLGFFYHTIRQVELMHQIGRLAPRYLILDTEIRQPPYARLQDWAGSLGLGRFVPSSMRDAAHLEFRHENHRIDGNTIDTTGLVATPTGALVGLLLDRFGFDWKRIDWSEKEITDWTFLDEYRHRRRASYFAERKGAAA